MEELLRDLVKILTTEVVSWTDDEHSRKAGAGYIAARLTELGYVKVVRCGECKLQNSPYCFYEGFDDDDYCPEGERKEGE